MQQYLSGKIIINELSKYFEILHTFRATCTQLPEISYKDHVELRVVAKKMTSLGLPTVDQWKIVEKYGKNKYRVHG